MNIINRKKLGNNIKKLRVKNNLTQKQFATKINLSEKTISNYERGKAAPKITTIKKIAILFRISSDYLLGLED